MKSKDFISKETTVGEIIDKIKEYPLDIRKSFLILDESPQMIKRLDSLKSFSKPFGKLK